MKVLFVIVSSLLFVEGAAKGSRRSSGGFKSGARAGGGGFKRRSTERKATKEAEAPTQQAPQQVHIHQSGGMGMGTTTAWMGLSLMDSIVQEQRRAEMMRNQLEQQKEIGKNQGEIAALKAQLEAQEKKVAEMQAEANK